MVQPNGICNKCKHEIEHGECISCGSSDNVNPSHYTKWKIPPNEYITANKLEWEVGNVIKYVTRYQDKNQAEDLNKAIKYIELLKERKYGSYKK